VLGAQLLTDLSGFVAALDSMFGGFRERAEQTYRVLQARETAFLLVATPEPDAVREAAYFAERLGADQMPLAGLVLNRVTTVAAEQSATLPFRHGAPDAEFDAVVECVSQALVAHRAAAADPLRDVLLGALDEQRVRVTISTCRHARPVGDHPHHPRPPSNFPP